MYKLNMNSFTKGINLLIFLFIIKEKAMTSIVKALHSLFALSYFPFHSESFNLIPLLKYTMFSSMDLKLYNSNTSLIRTIVLALFLNKLLK